VKLALLWFAFGACHEDAPPAPRRPEFSETFDVATFQKGNLHAHSRLSDGDSSPQDLVAWYRAHGYDFLALTDHNRRSEPLDYASLQDARFTLIAGEEISMTGAGRQVHVNALCTQRRIGGGAFDTPADALVWAVSEVQAQGGVAIINHPNFDRALVLDDLLAVKEAPLLEIASGHPYVFSNGIDNRPSHEALWDQALSLGARFTGVAVDDVHHLNIDADPPAFPGRAWVRVFSATNERDALCDALARGRLYASTGAELLRIRVTQDTYAITPAADADVSFSADGHVVQRAHVSAGREAFYVLRGERYVRADVVSSRGKAWTPPAFRAP